jgi:hypothetical protein
MPTVNWIQETAIDRLWERGSEPRVNPEPFTYTCRRCSRVFNTATDRDMHEIEHPVKNPALFIHGKEILESRLRITRRLKPGDIELSFIDNVQVNDTTFSSPAAAVASLYEIDEGFFELKYSNDITQKKVNIEICVAKQEDLDFVDQSFIQHFAGDGFYGDVISRFLADIKLCTTITNYTHGLVRYLHGLMAKDRRSSIIEFEKFNFLFSESLQYLDEYQTQLSSAIKELIRFNRNDFRFNNSNIGIPALAQSIRFLKGEELYRETANQDSKKLPVDNATAFIIELINHDFTDFTLNELEQKITSLNKKYLTLQDRNKLHYIAYRKALEVGDASRKEFYSRHLRIDDVFSGKLERRRN